MSLYGVVANVLDCELKTYYYVPFQTNTFEKSMNSLTLPAIG